VAVVPASADPDSPVGPFTKKWIAFVNSARFMTDKTRRLPMKGKSGAGGRMISFTT